MQHYNPDKDIDMDAWLAIDEDERLLLVESYHRSLDDIDMADEAIGFHNSLHVAVETQLAENNPPVTRQTLAKLTRQGLDRHESIHAISAILSQELVAAMQGEQKEFSTRKYRNRLDKLTAKRWRKDQY